MPVVNLQNGNQPGKPQDNNQGMTQFRKALHAYTIKAQQGHERILGRRTILFYQTALLRMHSDRALTGSDWTCPRTSLCHK
jgi:hypothetical protein